MATEVHQYTLTVPASTSINSPVTVTFGIANRVIESVDIEVPPGPAGLMGFYLTFNGQRIIPQESGEYLVWDDIQKSWTLDELPTTGKWALVGYNNDVNAHEVVVRQHTNYPPLPASPSPALVFVQSDVTGAEVTL